ncbi:PREDICTED: protein FAM83H [Cyprinodon variegatus]|uniref:Family with sequence similarity 83 member Hb n=1 Tax=Cyprinodon variegatus TaxID=28743 RepID=A0A3Q2GQ29_CYPVA|nr:PREDICTED: protein FAM83H [Cyprinodon variegatus]
MPHRSQSSSVGDNPLDPNYLPPHYREDYRLAIDALLEKDHQGYFDFLQKSDLAGFLSSTEIEHIKSTVQAPSQASGAPELTYYEGGLDAEGSSDTYWPMQSDLAAPGLDLGWPLSQHSFIGPTEVTTLVNPSEPEMPSIKEQARRLIKNARQVIAIAMDMFTDVDIFSDLLEAAGRMVPVYILLDEKDAPHFVAMVLSCKVNLESVHMMRVRTVAGVTYYSRSGNTFKGQLKDRFLLTDCRAVLSGNYSFMWSYEKIHRCMAHLFLGELVTTFDDEFRILYAQSEPLVIDQSIALAIPEPATSSYMNPQFGLKRSQSMRNPIGFRRQPEVSPAFPYGELDRNSSLPFRRNDPFRHTLEPSAGITIGKYSQQQFRLQQSFLEQGKSIVSRQMEMSSSAFKRHSYAEGTQENYSSSRQYMKHRVMNNLEETDFQREQISSSHYYTEGPGPGSGHGHYDRLRGRLPHLAIDQYSESSYQSDQEPPPGSRDYFSSEDLRGHEELHGPPVAGRYGGGSTGRRPTIGQPYACQSSPTHLHPPEKFGKQSDEEHSQDPSVKQGMRSWRIHSYLSTYEDGGEEGLPQPMGHDAFDEPMPPEQPSASDSLAQRFAVKDPPTVPPKPRPDIIRPRFGKPNMPESKNKDSAPATTSDLVTSFSDFRSSVLERRDREPEKERESERMSVREGVEDSESKETPDLFLSRHESFRSRVNPLLQRSSRLRSSLIFSSSKAEMHSGSLGLKPATEEDDPLDPGRTSSLVAQILEKRRSWSREPLDWRKKAEEKNNDKGKDEKEEKEKEKEKEEQQQKKEPENTYLTKKKETPHTSEKEEKTTVRVETTESKPSAIVSDLSSRLQYFKDLENKRKAPKIETEAQKAWEPAEKKPDLSEKDTADTTAPPKNPPINITSSEKEPKKPDIAAKLAELSRRPSTSSVKPSLITAKPFGSSLKLSETLQPHKKENEIEGQRKDESKSAKPPPSPKMIKKDQIKLKSLTLRRISCGDDGLGKDATDAEKSEMKKSRSYSSSTLTHEESKEGLHKVMGSNTSLNTIGKGKGEDKTLEFLKKQTQRLKGLLGPKDKEKKASSDDKGMSTVMEVSDDSSKKQGSSAKITTSTTAEQPATNHKESAGKSGPSRYQAQGSSALYSSNLRDDTKVILEQISANSQKNRPEREETGGDKESGDTDKGQETEKPFRKNRFLRQPGNTQEREGLLKRIESLRKEKKVYSRFEMGNSLA